MGALEESLHAVPQELGVIRLHLIERRQRQRRCALAELEHGPLAGEVSLVTVIVGIGRSADGAVLIAESGADAVAIDDVVAAADHPFAVVSWSVRKIDAGSKAVLVRRKNVRVGMLRRSKIVD